MSNILLPSNISSNVLRSPTNSETAETNRLLTIPVNTSATNDSQRRFALITSLIIANKSAGNVAINAKIINGSTSAYILFGVNVPSGTAFEVIQANKFILKESDSLYLWHNSSSLNVIDVALSYVLHDPITPYVV